VLNYLSEAAGFIIVQEREVTGTISITSHQPITHDEAVDLLNSVLVERGYTALRHGRILKIVSRSAARTMDLPVRSGSDPETIPRRDELVTQIIPVRYADAGKLIENIRPLLNEDVTLSANESSNAMVITDTLTNIRRIAEIIRALDTSIANISLIRVFPLEYAGAREVADVIREVFAPADGAARAGAQGLQRMMEARFRMGGGRPGGDTGTGTSEARQAASRVVAVADDFTNSLVVSAPDELMPTIEQIVQQLDSNIADITEVRVFRLEHSDATELADLVNQLYYDLNTTGQTQARGGAAAMRGRQGAATDQRSQRSLLQSRVIAVGDPRTNSLIVSAARETMMTIAEMVGRLDASSDKRQQVFMVPLEHADVENVAEVLRGMFETGTTTGRGTARATTTGAGANRLTQRVTQGAATANTTFNTTRGAGGGGR
jgi:general secretion pathway protein D